MTLFQQIERMEYIHQMVRMESTGGPDLFAKKLNLSRRQLYHILEMFNDLGAEIKYSRLRQTFYYASPFVMKIEVKIGKLNETDCKTILGGGVLNCINNEISFSAIELH